MKPEKETFKCVGCGHIEERDLGFAEAKDPAPEVNIMSIPPSIPASEPVEKKEGEDREYLDIGLHLVIGECNECSGNVWERISFGTLEKEEPRAERKDPGPLPTEKGFQDVIPPSPEHNPLDVMLSDTHSDVKKKEPTVEKHKCVDCGEEKATEHGDPGTCEVCGKSHWEAVPH
jgi:rubredoxin